MLQEQSLATGIPAPFETVATSGVGGSLCIIAAHRWTSSPHGLTRASNKSASPALCSNSSLMVRFASNRASCYTLLCSKLVIISGVGADDYMIGVGSDAGRH